MSKKVEIINVEIKEVILYFFIGVVVRVLGYY